MKYDIWYDCRNWMETGDAWLTGEKTFDSLVDELIV